MNRARRNIAPALSAIALVAGSASFAQERNPVEVRALSAQAAAPAITTLCVNPSGPPSCFATIQAAVTAAAPGDRIKISPGTYFENVVIPAGKNGLKVEGAAPVILDPDMPNAGIGIVVMSSNVELTNMTIRNGQSDGIRVAAGATGTLIKGIQVVGGEGDCLDIDGNGTKIENVTLNGCAFQAIDVDADDVQIRLSYMSRCGRGCIEIFGQRAVVFDNDMVISDDGECIDIDGNDARVEKNEMSECASDGIDVAGNNAMILQNKITTCDIEGIDVFGDFAVVKQNTIDGCDSGGISAIGEDPHITQNAVTHITGDDGFARGYEIDCDPCSRGAVSFNTAAGIADDCSAFDLFAAGPGMTVWGNKAERSGDSGFEISGQGILASYNETKTSGGDTGEAGILVTGTNHFLDENDAIGSHGDGMKISGTGHTVMRSKVEDNLEDGIDVLGTNITLIDNDSKRNIGIGIEISAGSIGTTVTDNNASKNRTDYCDEGGGTIAADNTFGTQGACAIDD